MSENKELRSRVSLLESGQRRCEHLAREWQNFGQYTAKVLKNEIETYEVKVQLLQEQVDKLSGENKELREMCLYLDRSGAKADESKLTPPDNAALLLHSSMIAKLNKKATSSVPQFSGLTSHTTLKDEQGRRRKEAWLGMSTREVLAEMKKRVETLEKEKLELIKVLQLEKAVLMAMIFHAFMQSLSAAHLLTASTSAGHHDSHKPSSHSVPSSGSEKLCQPPPDVGSISISSSQKGESESKAREAQQSDTSTSPELAINAATVSTVEIYG